MFGYIRPLKDELKVREYDAFRSCYCGMCHTLKDEYGLAASFILNFDFVYLAMLLWDPDEKPVIQRRRCIASPCKRKCCCASCPAMSRAAGYSVILTWWKLRDAVEDCSFLKSVAARAACLCLRKAYKKASAEYPSFCEATVRHLTELSSLEKRKCASVDEPADKFALLLADASCCDADEKRQRILRELFYHTGRWIYILDALDDLKDDIKNGSYNPLRECFDVKDGTLADGDLAAVSATLSHSRNICGASFELLKETAWTGIVRNIIALGMPGAAKIIESGGKLQKSRFRPAKEQ